MCLLWAHLDIICDRYLKRPKNFGYCEEQLL